MLPSHEIIKDITNHALEMSGLNSTRILRDDADALKIERLGYTIVVRILTAQMIALGLEPAHPRSPYKEFFDEMAWYGKEALKAASQKRR
jgi:hypothetical protein